MLDIKRVLDDLDAVKTAVVNKNEEGAVAYLESLPALEQQRKDAIAKGDELRSRRKALSKEVGQKKKAGEDASELMAESTRIGEELEALEAGQKDAETAIRDALLRIPNLPDADVPVGADDSANPEVARWGEQPSLGFEAKAHWDLGAELQLLDFEAGGKIAGSGFPLYTGRGARLERALINYMLDLHTTEHGYTEFVPPFLANSATLTGSGQLPKLGDDMYKLADDDLYLIPTAEVPLTNIHAGEIIPAAELPKRYTAYTPCFRREAGAAGRETRGLQRLHQFNKVELMTYVQPDESEAELERIRANAETVLQNLGLHYVVKLLCTGDTTFASAKTYDLEVWAPGLQKYLEVSSISNFRDYQARRANLRWRDDNKKVRFLHTLNGSGLATPRLMIALLETYQQADGSITVPEVLRPYTGGLDVITKT
ncbi:MAG: serine--tRNA ligase [Planctomycetota bacterium]|jgi:seryl-tRNA synthetase